LQTEDADLKESLPDLDPLDDSDLDRLTGVYNSSVANITDESTVMRDNFAVNITDKSTSLRDISVVNNTDKSTGVRDSSVVTTTEDQSLDELDLDESTRGVQLAIKVTNEKPHDANKNVQTCVICKRSFLRKSSLTRHLKTHDKPEKPLKVTNKKPFYANKNVQTCLICKRSFLSKSFFTRHLKMHEKLK
jgi:uncharacterized Zn-finger protein